MASFVSRANLGISLVGLVVVPTAYAGYVDNVALTATGASVSTYDADGAGAGLPANDGDASRAKDADRRTDWLITPGKLTPPGFVDFTYAFAAPTTIQHGRILAANAGVPLGLPLAFDVQTSSDNVTYTTVQSFNYAPVANLSSPGPTDTDNTQFILNAPVTTQYLRLHITNTQKEEIYSARASEIELYASPLPEILGGTGALRLPGNPALSGGGTGNKSSAQNLVDGSFGSYYGGGFGFDQNGQVSISASDPIIVGQVFDAVKAVGAVNLYQSDVINSPRLFADYTLQYLDRNASAGMTEAQILAELLNPVSTLFITDATVTNSTADILTHYLGTRGVNTQAYRFVATRQQPGSDKAAFLYETEAFVAIPEPSAIGLLALAGVGLARRARRR